MGWLGWTPAVALGTDAAIVEAALASRSDLLKMIFSTESPSQPARVKATPDAFRAFARRHNRRLAKDG